PTATSTTPQTGLEIRAVRSGGLQNRHAQDVGVPCRPPPGPRGRQWADPCCPPLGRYWWPRAPLLRAEPGPPHVTRTAGCKRTDQSERGAPPPTSDPPSRQPERSDGRRHVRRVSTGRR